VHCVTNAAAAPIRRLLQGRLLQFCLLLLLLVLPAPALAVSASAFSDTIPQERVLDQAGVLSRAASTDVARQLEALSAERVGGPLG